MVITAGQVAQAAHELKSRRGEVDNDYFGLLFIFGIDGYHIDRLTKNLHLTFAGFARKIIIAMRVFPKSTNLSAPGLRRVFYGH